VSADTQRAMEIAGKGTEGFRKGKVSFFFKKKKSSFHFYFYVVSSGVGAVAGGISAATGFVGKGIAAGGHYGYKKYQETDHYKQVRSTLYDILLSFSPSIMIPRKDDINCNNK